MYIVIFLIATIGVSFAFFVRITLATRSYFRLKGTIAEEAKLHKFKEMNSVLQVTTTPQTLTTQIAQHSTGVIYATSNSDANND